MRVKSNIQWCTLIFKEYSYLGIFVIMAQIIKLILGCDRAFQLGILNLINFIIVLIVFPN